MKAPSRYCASPLRNWIFISAPRTTQLAVHKANRPPRAAYSMRTPIFQVDAFAVRRFAGNPAAVMPTTAFWLTRRCSALLPRTLGRDGFSGPRRRRLSPALVYAHCRSAALRATQRSPAPQWLWSGSNRGAARCYSTPQRTLESQTDRRRLRHGLPGSGCPVRSRHRAVWPKRSASFP